MGHIFTIIKSSGSAHSAKINFIAHDVDEKAIIKKIGYVARKQTKNIRPYRLKRTRIPQFEQSAPSGPIGKDSFANENDLTLQLGQGFMMALKFVAETVE